MSIRVPVLQLQLVVFVPADAEVQTFSSLHAGPTPLFSVYSTERSP